MSTLVTMSIEARKARKVELEKLTKGQLIGLLIGSEAKTLENIAKVEAKIKEYETKAKETKAKDGEGGKSSLQSQASRWRFVLKVIKGEDPTNTKRANKATTIEDLDKRINESIAKIRKIKRSRSKENTLDWYKERDAIKSLQSRLSVSFKAYEAKSGSKHKLHGKTSKIK